MKKIEGIVSSELKDVDNRQSEIIRKRGSN